MFRAEKGVFEVCVLIKTEILYISLIYAHTRGQISRRSHYNSCFKGSHCSCPAGLWATWKQPKRKLPLYQVMFVTGPLKSLRLFLRLDSCTTSGKFVKLLQGLRAALSLVSKTSCQIKVTRSVCFSAVDRLFGVRNFRWATNSEWCSHLTSACSFMSKVR